MPKSAKKSKCVENTSENEYQADSNLSNESSSDDQEVFSNPNLLEAKRHKRWQVWTCICPILKALPWTGL